MRLSGSMLMLAATMAATGAISASVGQQSTPRTGATFLSDGAAVLPVGYRQWTHIGTRLKPIGINILDGEPTKTPEIFNAYVEPEAFAAHERSGLWPEGSRIVKEFSAVRIGEGCDPKTLLCDSALGPGIFESGFIGLGMMIKDSSRFADSPGHWGYFSFGHKPPPYDAAAHPSGNCAGCHVKLASDTDYVISRAHIGLASENPR
jgi:hypothetical protein